MGTPPQAISYEDRIGTLMKYIRAMEKGYVSDISGCLERYPKICELVANPYDFQGNLSQKLRPLRDHVVELAKEHALDELRKSREDLQGSDLQRGLQARQKKSRLIFKISPGRSCGIGAVQNKHGEALTNPDGMAKVLKDHWANIFKKKGINGELLEKWIKEGEDSIPVKQAFDCANLNFKLRKRNIRQAIKHSNNSCTGPNGIPFFGLAKVLEFCN